MRGLVLFAWFIEWARPSFDDLGAPLSQNPDPPLLGNATTVSSEAECRVKALTIIASGEVEVLDVFALLGSLESMDYRKLGTLQGSPMEDGRVFFNVNTAPFPPMWQLQLKVSSRAPAVVIHELSVQVDKTAGGAGIPTAAATTSSSSGKPLATTSNALADTAMFQTGRSSLGASISAPTTAKSRHGLGATMATTADFDASATITSLGLSRSRAAAAPAATTSSSLAATASATATSAAAAAAKPSASGTSTSTHPLAASTTTTALASLSGARASAASASSDLAVRGATSTALSTGGPSLAETAAVASVLNAVCEKMVGVVSEKTKAYLAKAGKRTERRVLDKMAKLEARIERFDDVLKHTTASSSQIEETLLALNRELLSPCMPVATSS